jgi:hypothetical protein
MEAGGETFGKFSGLVTGINGIGTSSSSSPSDDSDVVDTSLSEISCSLSVDDSVAVEGSYSCFKGDDERRLFL